VTFALKIKTALKVSRKNNFSAAARSSKLEQMGIFFCFCAITPKLLDLGIQMGSRTLITFEKHNFFSLGKKLYTGFLKGSQYKSRVLGYNRISGIHGLTLGFRGLITFVNPNYFLTRNISFIHENPVSFHFRPPPIQIFEKTVILPLLPKYWSESDR